MDDANTDNAIPSSKCKFLTETEVKAALPDYHSQTSLKKNKILLQSKLHKVGKKLGFQTNGYTDIILTNKFYLLQIFGVS